MSAYYPVTEAEIAYAAARRDGTTIPVRQDAQTTDGRIVVLLSYGSPMAYRVIRHAGLFYGVFTLAPEAELHEVGLISLDGA